MKKQIATATVVGPMLALACLLWEQQSVAARSRNNGQAMRTLRAKASPFDRQLRYCNAKGPEAGLAA
jgi:hypothetical protein